MLEWFKKSYNKHYLILLKEDEVLRNDVDWFCTQVIPDYKKNDFVKLDNPQDFDMLMELIYKVRCNLFHGSQRPDITQNRKLVERTTRILGTIYRPLLDADRRRRKNYQSILVNQYLGELID
jgi:hypothetical protein